MKETINIVSCNGFHKVLSLTNRREPKVGICVSDKELDELLLEAKRGHLTVNITSGR